MTDTTHITSSGSNDRCPECNKPMQWVEGLLNDGSRSVDKGRYSCMKCRIFMKPIESRAISKGKKMAESLIGVHCMDKKITSNSVGVQIGIFRARQHCATCGNSMGNPCTCKGKCNCLYCRTHKGETL